MIELVNQPIKIKAYDYIEYYLLDGKRKLGRLIVRSTEYSYWISDVVIYKKYRGKGYSKILLEGVISELKDNIPICLSVKEDNYIAIRVYEKLGFKNMGLWFGKLHYKLIKGADHERCRTETTDSNQRVTNIQKSDNHD